VSNISSLVPGSCRPALRDLARELPPGAPQAESATEEVLQAVAAAGEGRGPCFFDV